ncbi:hypothetical protein Tco_0889472 [Tanacetum coccineum]
MLAIPRRLIRQEKSRVMIKDKETQQGIQGLGLKAWRALSTPLTEETQVQDLEASPSSINRPLWQPLGYLVF